MVCQQCGTINRDGARFCQTCGARLAELPTAPVQPVDAGAAQSDGLAGEQPVTTEPAPATVAPRSIDAAPLDPAAPPLPGAATAMAGESENLVADQGEMLQPGQAGIALDDALLEAEPEASIAEPTLLAKTAGEADAVEPGRVAPPPLAVGAIINDHYEILDVRPDDGQTLYRVRDRQACLNCGAPRVEPDDLYCDNCGSALAEQTLTMREAQGDDEPARVMAHDGHLLTLMSPEATSPASSAPTLLGGLTVGLRTDPGLQRPLNEDSVSALTWTALFESRLATGVGLYIVADGMGGHEGGEVASRLAVETVNAVLLPLLLGFDRLGPPPSGAFVNAVLLEAVQQANAQIVARGAEGHTDMGSALTLALVIGSTAYIANVGDSRVYHWSGNLLRQVTEDHSMVWSLFRTGQITQEEIYSHPQRNLIYRNLGAGPTVDVDIFMQPLAPGDRLILCSDGLWEMVRDDGSEAVLNAISDPQAACDELVRQANAAGGEDNISVVVVKLAQQDF